MYGEDHGLRISKNGVLRKMFGPDREGKTEAGGLHSGGYIIISIPQLKRSG